MFSRLFRKQAMNRMNWAARQGRAQRSRQRLLSSFFQLEERVTPDSTPQSLPFSQNWTNTGLIITDDNWSGVPGIIGYRGDDLTTATGTDPQTILADGTTTPVDVNANQTSPNTFATGGVAEFHITDPVVALQGSGTADAPFILLHLNTTGHTGITIAYNLRDIDGSADNAVQPVALQYRVGNTGNFTNVPAGFVADATTGPTLATLVTPVSVTLPAAVDNQAQVQVRIMTTNAVGNDEWVGIDDISVTGTPIPSATMSATLNTPAAGDLTIADTDATGKNNNWTITYDGTNFIISDVAEMFAPTSAGTLSNGNKTLTVPGASVTGQVFFQGNGGSDLLTVDWMPGDFPRNINFDGGAGTSDKLAVKGGNTKSATYTPNSATPGMGTIVVGTQTTSFSNLEPVDLSGMVTATVASPATVAANSLVLNAGADSATGLIPAIVVSGSIGATTIEAAHLFNNMTVVLDTSATTGANTITVSSAIPLGHNNTNITLKTTASGSVTVNTALDVTGALDVRSPLVNLNANLTAAPIMGTAATVIVDDNPSGQIQDGVAVAADGALVTVLNGTYVESNITLDKALTIAGQSQAGVIIVSDTLDDHTDADFGGSYHYGFVIASSNVTIHDLTIDGQAAQRFGAGIIEDNSAPRDNLVVHHVTVQNVFRRGIQFTLRGTGNQIFNTMVQTVGPTPSNSAIGIAVFGGGTSGTPLLIQNNIVSGAYKGIATNFENPGPGTFPVTATISGNQVSGATVGLDLAGLDGGTVVGGATPAAANTVDVSGGTDGVGMVVKFSNSAAATPITVQGNTITGTANDAGVWLIANTNSANPIVVRNNQITATASTATANGQGTGILLSDNTTVVGVAGSSAASYAIIAANTITGFARGIDLFRNAAVPAGGSIVGATIGGAAADNNTITGPGATVAGSVGIRVLDADGLTNSRNAVAFIQNNGSSIGGAAAATGFAIGVDVDGGDATLSGNLIRNNATGVRVTNGGRLIVNSGNTISGGATGLRMDGATVELNSPAPTLNNTIFSGQSGDYITLANSALDNQVVNGTGVTYDTVLGSAATPAEAAAIESKITHQPDNLTLGLISFSSTTIIGVSSVAATGTTPTPTDNDYTRIKNAVVSATPGTVINLTGTFDWTELNAATSWAAGNDGNPATTADNYTITLPGNLNNVTVTASGALGSARIQGPGDIATVDLEAVFVADGANGTNQGWTFSKLEIFDFDVGILYFAGSNGDAFDGTKIQNNHIRVPVDSAAGTDAFQNIAIHYGFGDSQVISGNVIDLTAGPTGSSSVGIQTSDTFGGATLLMNGLQIMGNTINVTGVGSPAGRIRGIWENSAAYGSTITVSGNQYLGFAPTAGTDTTAFQVTSHSTAAGTVTYSGNMVQGANIGFQWISALNYAGLLPVQLTNNTLTNALTGILVQSNGSVAFGTGNTITGGTTGLVVDGAGSSIGAAGLNNLAFSGQSGNYITLSGGAMDNQEVNGTSATFGGSTGAAATLAQNFAIEDKITHATDNNTLGFVRVKAANVFVTPNSGSIQRGVDAALAGDTVNVAASTYTENITVNTRIILDGAGSGTTAGDTIIQSAAANTPVITLTAGGTGAASRLVVRDVRVTGATGAGNLGTGIRLDNNPSFLTFDNVTVTGNAGYGIAINSTGSMQDVRILNSTLSNNVSGFRVPTSLVGLDGLTITNSTFSGNTIGLEVNATVGNTGLTNVAVSDTQFTNNLQKGAYFERLNNATFTNITVTGNGTDPTFPSGIDVNLKYATYGNISFNAATFTNNGTGSTTGNSLTIKARNDNAGSPLYSATPATLNGLTLTNVSVTGSPVDLSVGNNVTLGSVAMSGVSLNGTGRGLVVFANTAGQTLNAGNTTFAGTLATYAENASPGTTVNATGATFNGVAAASLTTAQAYTVVDKIVDSVDAGTLLAGSVRVKAGQVFVTPNSFFSPVTTTPSVQRGIDSAVNGDTLHIQSGAYTGGADATLSPTKGVTLDPGSSPGVVTITGNLKLDGNDALFMEINGTDPLTQFDNFNITGTVTLGGASLNVAASISPFTGSFAILNNDLADAVSGQFAQGTSVSGGSVTFTINYAGGTGNDVVLTAQAPPGISGLQVGPTVATLPNQRSRVDRLVVTFGESLGVHPDSAFSLVRVGGAAVPLTVTWNADFSRATLTFSGPLVSGGSLTDGRYRLSVDGSQLITTGGLAVDADGDRAPGGTLTFDFHRLFGDSDGDADTDFTDLAQFRLALGGPSTTPFIAYNPAFDSDGDGDVDFTDLAQFRLRLGTVLA